MRKIKYQGGFTKHITSKIGKNNRKKFNALINTPGKLAELCKKINELPDVNMDIVSFSSSDDFSEQTLSILSYIKYVGTPASWTIYSDGSHTSEQINLLETTIRFVKIKKIDLLNELEVSNNLKSTLMPWQNELLHYANNEAFGKKLFYYMNHPVKKQTLFLDSDILFYNKASVLIYQLNKEINGYFLPDIEWGTLDSRYLQKNTPQLYQVNGGFYIANKEISFINDALDYLKDLNGKYEYFSEQTAMHVLLLGNYFMPLDPRIFILNTDDQFDFSYLFFPEKIAIRHYTGPVRHKMWQKDWKWQLSIT